MNMVFRTYEHQMKHCKKRICELIRKSTQLIGQYKVAINTALQQSVNDNNKSVTELMKEMNEHVPTTCTYAK